MKLHVKVYRDVGGRSEVRLADPPFDTRHLVSFHETGRVVVFLPMPVVDAMRAIDEDEPWFDAIQWDIPFAELVTNFIEFFTTRDAVMPTDPLARAEIERTADALEEAVLMLRTLGVRR